MEPQLAAERTEQGSAESVVGQRQALSAGPRTAGWPVPSGWQQCPGCPGESAQQVCSYQECCVLVEGRGSGYWKTKRNWCCHWLHPRAAWDPVWRRSWSQPPPVLLHCLSYLAVNCRPAKGGEWTVAVRHTTLLACNAAGFNFSTNQGLRHCTIPWLDKLCSGTNKQKSVFH